MAQDCEVYSDRQYHTGRLGLQINRVNETIKTRLNDQSPLKFFIAINRGVLGVVSF